MKAAFRLYTAYLRKKWNMTSEGAGVLAGEFYKDYKNNVRGGGTLRPIWNAHKRGFTFSDWRVMGLDNEKCNLYISNAQYYGKHPFNGRYGKWIDDKLTLKYLCAGTILDEFMPKYYFMTDAHGEVLRLLDCPDSINASDSDGIVSLLKIYKVLAAKRIAGAIGEGFYRLEYIDGTIYVNGIETEECAFKAHIERLHNYLFIEFLWPHEQLAKFCPNTCNTLRYLVGRINGNLKMIKSYIRLGAIQSGYVENYNAGGVLCYVDENGGYSGGNILDLNTKTNRRIMQHPDTNVRLEGVIPQWSDIQHMVELIGRQFPQLKYMGIDVVITSDCKVKMLEINSLTSIDGIQLTEPVANQEIIAFLTGK